MQKVKKLIKGSTIGIAGPANYAEAEEIEKGKSVLERMGYKVILGEGCSKKWFSFSGTDEIRARDFENMFINPEVDAVMALRGGYGCSRLTGLIDFELIKKHPKLFIGFSDTTLLHIILNQACGIPTVHGPMLTSESTMRLHEKTRQSFVNLVSGRAMKIFRSEPEMGTVLKEGNCKGLITGGNLEMMRCSLGTSYEIDTLDKILFIEETGEYSYRIDRTLQQLKDAGKFENCNGVIFGDFRNCTKHADCDFGLNEVIRMHVSDLNVPVISDIHAGHCNPTVSLPFGCEVELQAELNGKISLKLINDLFV